MNTIIKDKANFFLLAVNNFVFLKGESLPTNNYFVRPNCYFL